MERGLKSEGLTREEDQALIQKKESYDHPDKPEKENQGKALPYSAPISVPWADTVNYPSFNNNTGNYSQARFFQKAYGNIASLRLNRKAIQAKLKIGQPNDKYEQEADRIAERVMRMPDRRCIECKEEERSGEKITRNTRKETNLLQRQETEESLKEEAIDDDEEKIPKEKEESLLQTKLISSRPYLIQRQLEDEELEEESERIKEPLREKNEDGFIKTKLKKIEKSARLKRSGSKNGSITPGVEWRISSMRSGGQPLSKTICAFFEPCFGAGFSGIRIHTDSNAAHLSKSIKARAFTVGKHIVFGSNQYTPDSSVGKQLLAHELTHVLQQNGGLNGDLNDKRHRMRIASRRADLVGRITSKLGKNPVGVKVKPDAEAQRSPEARDISGLIEDGHVYLHPDRYNPKMKEGQRLLAHKVVYVAQRVLSRADTTVSQVKSKGQGEAAALSDTFVAGSQLQAPTVRLPAVARAADVDAEHNKRVQRFKEAEKRKEAEQGRRLWDEEEEQQGQTTSEGHERWPKDEAVRYDAALLAHSGSGLTPDGWKRRAELAAEARTTLSSEERVRIMESTDRDPGPIPIYHGPLADRLTRALDMAAVSLGKAAFIPKNRFNRSTRRGRALLDHEVTHTLQSQPLTGQLTRAPSVHFISSNESQAEQVAFGIRSQLTSMQAVGFRGHRRVEYRPNLLLKEKNKRVNRPGGLNKWITVWQYYHWPGRRRDKYSRAKSNALNKQLASGLIIAAQGLSNGLRKQCVFLMSSNTFQSLVVEQKTYLGLYTYLFIETLRHVYTASSGSSKWFALPHIRRVDWQNPSFRKWFRFLLDSQLRLKNHLPKPPPVPSVAFTIPEKHWKWMIGIGLAAAKAVNNAALHKRRRDLRKANLLRRIKHEQRRAARTGQREHARGRKGIKSLREADRAIHGVAKLEELAIGMFGQSHQTLAGSSRAYAFKEVLTLFRDNLRSVHKKIKKGHSHEEEAELLYKLRQIMSLWPSEGVRLDQNPTYLLRLLGISIGHLQGAETGSKEARKEARAVGIYFWNYVKTLHIILKQIWLNREFEKLVGIDAKQRLKIQSRVEKGTHGSAYYEMQYQLMGKIREAITTRRGVRYRENRKQILIECEFLHEKLRAPDWRKHAVAQVERFKGKIRKHPRRASLGGAWRTLQRRLNHFVKEVSRPSRRGRKVYINYNAAHAVYQYTRRFGWWYLRTAVKHFDYMLNRMRRKSGSLGGLRNMYTIRAFYYPRAESLAAMKTSEKPVTKAVPMMLYWGARRRVKDNRQEYKVAFLDLTLPGANDPVSKPRWGGWLPSLEKAFEFSYIWFSSKLENRYPDGYIHLLSPFSTEPVRIETSIPRLQEALKILALLALSTAASFLAAAAPLLGVPALVSIAGSTFYAELEQHLHEETFVYDTKFYLSVTELVMGLVGALKTGPTAALSSRAKRLTYRRVFFRVMKPFGNRTARRIAGQISTKRAFSAVLYKIEKANEVAALAYWVVLGTDYQKKIDKIEAQARNDKLLTQKEKLRRQAAVFREALQAGCLFLANRKIGETAEAAGRARSTSSGTQAGGNTGQTVSSARAPRTGSARLVKRRPSRRKLRTLYQQQPERTRVKLPRASRPLRPSISGRRQRRGWHRRVQGRAGRLRQRRQLRLSMRTRRLLLDLVPLPKRPRKGHRLREERSYWESLAEWVEKARLLDLDPIVELKRRKRLPHPPRKPPRGNDRKSVEKQIKYPGALRRWKDKVRKAGLDPEAVHRAFRGTNFGPRVIRRAHIVRGPARPLPRGRSRQPLPLPTPKPPPHRLRSVAGHGGRRPAKRTEPKRWRDRSGEPRRSAYYKQPSEPPKIPQPQLVCISVMSVLKTYYGGMYRLMRRYRINVPAWVNYHGYGAKRPPMPADKNVAYFLHGKFGTIVARQMNLPEAQAVCDRVKVEISLHHRGMRSRFGSLERYSKTIQVWVNHYAYGAKRPQLPGNHMLKAFVTGPLRIIVMRALKRVQGRVRRDGRASRNTQNPTETRRQDSESGK